MLRSALAFVRRVCRRRDGPGSWGSLRRVEPLSRSFGFERGTPVDRRYIEGFLAAHAGDIRGRVLEVGDDSYTRRFGTGVTRCDVLNAVPGDHVTVVGDLATGAGIPVAAYDCIILTQTLPFIFDVAAAVRTCCRALVPGGVVLVTVPGISQISRHDMDRWGDFWRFTDLSVRRLFAAAFGPSVVVQVHGNVLAAVALMHGVAAEELTASELAAQDRDYQVLITVRAIRAMDPPA
jgi:hypothetical protein